jgi:hypothetical protein
MSRTQEMAVYDGDRMIDEDKLMASLGHDSLDKANVVAFNQLQGKPNYWTGVCKYCGQGVVVDKSSTVNNQSEAQERATLDCKCIPGAEYRRRMRGSMNLTAVLGEITVRYGKFFEHGIDIDEGVQSLLEQGVQLLNDTKLNKLKLDYCGIQFDLSLKAVQDDTFVHIKTKYTDKQDNTV